jgi:hypothetical protein
MTETSRSFYTPTRQAAEDRSVIDHLVKTFHADPLPTHKATARGCEISARILPAMDSGKPGHAGDAVHVLRTGPAFPRCAAAGASHLSVIAPEAA